MAELPVEDLKGVEIFAAGTQTDSSGRKMTWTVANLREMVENFKNFKGIKPVLKLMHLSPQDHRKVTAMPALGRISDLRVQGNVLVADFARVPRKVAQLIRAGSYNRISAEIFRRFRDDASGRTFNNVVSAAGLLGAVHPAVTTLKDVLDLFELSDDELAEYEFGQDEDWSDCYEGAMSFALAKHEDIQKEKPKDGGENEMDAKELKAFEDRMDAKLETATAKIQAKADKEVAEFKSSINEVLGVDADADTAKAIKALKADNDAKSEAAQEAETKQFEAAVEGVFVAAIKDGKMLPAEKATYQAVANTLRAEADANGKATFSIADKDVTGEPVELLKKMFEARGKVMSFNKESGKTGGNDDVKTTIPRDLRNPVVGGFGETPATYTGQDQNAMVEAYMKEHKCDFHAAFEAVFEIEVDQHSPEGAAAAFSRVGGDEIAVNR